MSRLSVILARFATFLFETVLRLSIVIATGLIVVAATYFLHSQTLTLIVATVLMFSVALWLEIRDWKSRHSISMTPPSRQ